ncbi:MAG: glycosyltransferase family 87 protein [bacterium]
MTKKILILTIGLISILLSVFYPGWWLLHHRSVDLPSYYVAGYMLRQNVNPYHPDEIRIMALQVELSDPIYPYVYFPLVALAFMPLSLIRYQTVQLLWFGMSLIFFWLSLLLLYFITRRCYPSDSKLFFNRFLLLIPITCLSHPLIVNFRHGQINAITLFLICAFLYLLMTDSEILAGIALALVISIKPQPAIILPFLLYKKRFRCVSSTIISFATVTYSTVFATGWDNFRFYLRNILPSFSLVQNQYQRIFLYEPPNQSLQGIISRAFQTTKYSRGLWEKPELAILVACIALPTILMISFYKLFTWNRNKPTTDQALLRDCSYLLLTSLLISPITWDHHLVTIYPIAALLLFDKPGPFWKSPAGIMILFCWILMFIPLFEFHPIWTLNKLASLGMSIKGFALLGFWTLLTISG